VERGLAQGVKAQPFVEASGSTLALDVESDGSPGGCRLGQDPTHEHRPDPSASVFWEQRDVEHANLVEPPRDVEPADRTLAGADDVIRGVGEFLPVVVVLGRELKGEKGRLLGGIPGEDLQLLLACAGIDLEQEGAVLGSGGSQGDLGGQLKIAS
jgi:hypothetical protein